MRLDFTGPAINIYLHLMRCTTWTVQVLVVANFALLKIKNKQRPFLDSSRRCVAPPLHKKVTFVPHYQLFYGHRFASAFASARYQPFAGVGLWLCVIIKKQRQVICRRLLLLRGTITGLDFAGCRTNSVFLYFELLPRQLPSARKE